MNKADLKRLKIDDSYVIDPTKFLIRMGIECSRLDSKVTIHDLHYILHNRLHHASIKNVSVDKVFRGDIILIGKPTKFYPYYNPLRCKIPVTKVANCDLEEKPIVVDLKIYSMTELYRLYQQTVDLKYLDEIYDRTYATLKEEQAPAKIKIYSKTAQL